MNGYYSGLATLIVGIMPALVFLDNLDKFRKISEFEF
jgi:hypothetical protein